MAVITPSLKGITLTYLLAKIEKGFPSTRLTFLLIYDSSPQLEAPLHEVLKRFIDDRYQIKPLKFVLPKKLSERRAVILNQALYNAHLIKGDVIVLPLSLDDLLVDFLYSAFTSSPVPWSITRLVLCRRRFIAPLLRVPDDEIYTYFHKTPILTKFMQLIGRGNAEDGLERSIREFLAVVERERLGMKFTALRFLERVVVNVCLPLQNGKDFNNTG